MKNFLAVFQFIEHTVLYSLVMTMLVETHNGLIRTNPEMMWITFTQISMRSD